MARFPKFLYQKVENAPVDPGCYLFKDEHEKIIYIGKAKQLRNRVKTYFSAEDRFQDAKTQSLLKHVRDIEFIITHSEVEALILENTLIKEHRPRYNIFLKDDKTFPYVRITDEPFPRVFLTRKLVNDGSKYFGPYTDARTIRETIRIIKKVFTVRNCHYRLDSATVAARKVKLCLQYHIHNCEGPCQQLISAAEYNRMIAQVITFLKGHSAEVVDYLEQKMETAAKQLRFEIAARYRDNIRLLRRYFYRQAVEIRDFKDRDVISLIVEEDTAAAIVLRLRQGKLLSRDTFFLERVAKTELADVMSTFLQRYYDRSQLIPAEISVNVYPHNQKILEEWLADLCGRSVKISRPVREEKLRLVQLAEKNARAQLAELLLKKSKATDYIPKSLKRLQHDLNLAQLPRRIEAFDISNLQGKQAVASLVTFQNASPLKSEYRRYRIKTVKGIDDVAMMREVVQRRYSRVLKEAKPLPDLVVIDGGRGQLSGAKKELDRLELTQIPVIGLTKRLEEVFLLDQPEPLVLARDSTSLILLQRIRDEAHRFAITYHRNLRHKTEFGSILDQIHGLGAAKKKNLMEYFTSVKKIRSASVEQLRQVNGIGRKLAQSIWDFMHHG
ncbi:MAG TPA: excinuclease ABC subunit C [Candidatus Marinimicrobia bacterium]|nr:excinuclease ABC subunit C [Candidatus Neomarinimicrobiota bacterium]